MTGFSVDKSAGEPAIPAATIVLVRDAPTTGLEVLMIERHRDITFAGGALVFPGGRVDPGDAAEEWAGGAVGLEDVAEAERASYIAAIREAFEETGVLFAYDVDGRIVSSQRARALGKWRQEIEADDAKFLTLMKKEALKLACDRLQLFAHWLPPEGFHNKRFDTRFFAAAAPPDHVVTADGGEATEAIWISPADAIAAAERGERKIIFPTMRNLELLALSDSADGVLQFARERTIRRVQPQLVERDGAGYLTIPDDLGYPVTEEALTSMKRD